MESKAAGILLNCPECRGLMELRTSHTFKYRNGEWTKFWRCRDINCSGKHSAHPDGTPLGKPANKDTRQARFYLHLLIDRVWDPEDREQKKNRDRWLHDNTPTGHVSDMDYEEVWKTIKKLEMLEI